MADTASFLLGKGAHSLKVRGMLPSATSDGYTVHITRSNDTSEGVEAVLLLRETRATHFDISLVAVSGAALERAVLSALGGGRCGSGSATFCFAAVDRLLLPALELAAVRLGCHTTWREPCRLWTCEGEGEDRVMAVAAGWRVGDVLPLPLLPAASAAAASTAAASTARLVWLRGNAHAASVNDHWKYKSATSIDTVRAMLAAGRSCPCVGVEVRAAEDAPWTLASWCTCYGYKALGMLGTTAAHQRRGFARACAAAVAATLLEAGEPAFSYIVEGNVASEQLFAKLGFEAAPGYSDWVGWARNDDEGRSEGDS